MTSDSNTSDIPRGEHYIEEPLSPEWQRFFDAWYLATPEEQADVKQFVSNYQAQEAALHELLRSPRLRPALATAKARFIEHQREQAPPS